MLEALRQPLEEGRVAIARAGRVDDVPGPLPARRGDEPVSVRLRRARSRSRCRCRPGVPSATPAGSRVRSATGSTCGSTMPRVAAGRRWSAARAGGVRRSVADADRGRPRRGSGGARRAGSTAGSAVGELRRIAALTRLASRRVDRARRARRRRAAAARSGCSASPARSPTSRGAGGRSSEHLDEAAVVSAAGRRAMRGRWRADGRVGRRADARMRAVEPRRHRQRTRYAPRARRLGGARLGRRPRAGRFGGLLAAYGSGAGRAGACGAARGRRRGSRRRRTATSAAATRAESSSDDLQRRSPPPRSERAGDRREHSRRSACAS